MGIRNKIVLYFSVVTIALVAAAFLFIHTLFYQYREQGFQLRQKEKIETTLKFLTQIKDLDDDLIEAMDRLSINDLYDEKLLIFNKDRALLYASIDDTPIEFSSEMLAALSKDSPLIEQKDGLYDVVGIYMEREGRAYYGISKAYDKAGYAKSNYLKFILLVVLSIITIIVVLVSWYLSRKITFPIMRVTQQIKDFRIGDNMPTMIAPSRDEIGILSQRFNELMTRTNDAFAFQKHAVHHISHELKTPIAILVSAFEKMENERDPETLRALLAVQKENTKSLGEIINSLLEIAKTESGNSDDKAMVRIDELIFDLAGEFENLHPHFHFSISYSQDEVNEQKLQVAGNPRLLKAALSNLMMNCIQYTDDNKAQIIIRCETAQLVIEFTNNGATLSPRDQEFLFQHFFRGSNSLGKRGFGLGLVFVNKIVQLYGGRILYKMDAQHQNIFSLHFPIVAH